MDKGLRRKVRKIVTWFGQDDVAHMTGSDAVTVRNWFEGTGESPSSKQSEQINTACDAFEEVMRHYGVKGSYVWFTTHEISKGLTPVEAIRKGELQLVRHAAKKA